MKRTVVIFLKTIELQLETSSILKVPFRTFEAQSKEFVAEKWSKET